ncbi:MAG: 16S rRNA processing protein RimM [Gammaproteobacteria bacterium]|nr:16S rRNA processing protein RimM [Gammaproteobacteria bacterium]
MTEKLHETIAVARIGAPHGLQGHLKLFPLGEGDLFDWQHFLIQYPGRSTWQKAPPFELSEKADQFYVRFEDTSDRDLARKYTQALLGINRDELPALEEGEFYWSDLEGLEVVNLQGIVLGKIDHLLETGANDVMVVKGDRERLLPYSPDTVHNIDLAKGVMTVDWDADF